MRLVKTYSKQERLLMRLLQKLNSLLSSLDVWERLQGLRRNIHWTENILVKFPISSQADKTVLVFLCRGMVWRVRPAVRLVITVVAGYSYGMKLNQIRISTVFQTWMENFPHGDCPVPIFFKILWKSCEVPCMVPPI